MVPSTLIHTSFIDANQCTSTLPHTPFSSHIIYCIRVTVPSTLTQVHSLTRHLLTPIIAQGGHGARYTHSHILTHASHCTRNASWHQVRSLTHHLITPVIDYQGGHGAKYTHSLTHHLLTPVSHCSKKRKHRAKNVYYYEQTHYTTREY